MLIDWFTIGAQALNFVILVWLLKHFLYKPILNAIDAREKKIAAELADAAAKKAEAQKDRDEFQHKNEEFDLQRAALLSKATDEAKAERQRLLDEARKAADAASAKRQEALQVEAHNRNQAIGLRAQQEVFAIARKALTDLATASLEERLAAVFTRRLREMNGQAKTGLAQALKSATDPAIVRSAFELPPDQRAVIQNALNETFSADIHIRFETAPDIVSGIELTANGQKVAWSIAEYLSSMEKSVDALLKAKDKPIVKPKPQPEAKAEPKPEAQPAAKAEPKPDTEAGPKTEPAADPTPGAKVEPKSDTGPKPIPEAKPEPKSEAQSAAKAEPKTDTKVGPKAEPAADPTPESKVQPKPDTGPKPKPQAEVKPKPEGKPMSDSKVVPKSEGNAKPPVTATVEPIPEKNKLETKSL